MTKHYLRFYYILITYIVFNYGWGFFNKPLTKPTYISFARILDFVSTSNSHLTYLIVFIMTVATLLITFCKPTRPLRIISCAFVLLIGAMKFSFGSISHHDHIWYFSSVVFCFFNIKQPLQSQCNTSTFFALSGLFLAIYFNSGLWKLRSLLSISNELSFFQSLKEGALEAIGHTYAIGSGSPMLTSEFISSHLDLIVFGFTAVIVFELSCFLPFIYKNLFIFYFLLAATFHSIIGLTMGHWFSNTFLMGLFLYASFPLFSSDAEKKVTLG